MPGFDPDADKRAKVAVALSSQTRQNFDTLVGRIMKGDKDLTWEDLILQCLPFMHEAVIHEKWARILLWGAEHDGENFKGKVMPYHPSKNRKLREELVRDLMTQAGIWIKEKADMLSDMGWKRGMSFKIGGKKSISLWDAIMGEED